MAFIDYGALLRVNGKFINKNEDMFMDLIYETVTEEKGNEIQINGNYFVGAGDKDFYLVFYKSIFHVISNGEIIHTDWDNPFDSEIFYIDNFPNVKVEHIDKNIYSEYSNKLDNYDREFYLNRYGKKLGQLKINGRCKKSKRSIYNYKTQKYLATWDYNGDKYEVIFGYGIECNEKSYNDIKNNSYNYTDIERELIDSWFKGEQLW